MLKPLALAAGVALLMSSGPLRAATAPVTVREENTVIPTYLAGAPEPNPMFYFGQSSQGAKCARSLAEDQLRNSHHAVTAFAERCVQTGLASFHDLSTADAGFFFNWNHNPQPPMAVMTR
jgi:hypothetical protein